jgi:hypothetical protein
MKEVDRKMRNLTRLDELHPSFHARIERVILALEAKGIRPRIQEAWRSPARQEQAFLRGTSRLRFGFHNVTRHDGKPNAFAVDLLDDNFPLKPGKKYLLQLAAAAEAEGLITGIRWGLPDKLAAAIDAAIAAENWNANVKVGWDPTHVEPAHITVAQARDGITPD